MIPREWIEETFPRLRDDPRYDSLSPIDSDYNCIAFAAGDTQRFWWPPASASLSGGSYWPPQVPPEQTVEAFIIAFATLGYERCDDGSFERNFEKVAIYAKDGLPTHAARQWIDERRWLSKLGSGFDIAHAEVDGVGGDLYGDVVVYMRRSTHPL